MSSYAGPFDGENGDEEEDEEAEEERCRIPRGKDRLTWLIENLAYHFAAAKRVYGYVKEVCTAKSCPSMTAGPQYEYLWIDEVGYSKPTRLAACKYISRLFHHWCDLILLDHTFGPPQGCEELLGTVFRRLFRVYGHIYYSHLRKIVAHRKEAELNRFFKRLVLFSWHHKLIPPSEMEPLQSLINTLLCIKPYCYLTTGTGLVAAHAYRRATFTLQAVERNHSAIGSGGDKLTCHLQDPNGVILPTHIKDSRQAVRAIFLPDGTYAVTYLPTEPGRFSFHFSSLTKTKVVAEGFKVQVFPSLASDLIKVLTEEQFVDVTFKAGDTRNAIKAHKMIINARLKGFEILNIIDEIQLSSSVRETTFREFIKYIYTGYVDTRNMKNYMIAELLLMAKNYGLEVLEKALERMENGGQDKDEDENEDDEANKGSDEEGDNDDKEDEEEDEEQEEEEEKEDEEDEDGDGDDHHGDNNKKKEKKKKEKAIAGLGYGSEGEGIDASKAGYDGDDGYNDSQVDNNDDDDDDGGESDGDYVGGRKKTNKKNGKRKKKKKGGQAQVRKKRRRGAINDFSYRDHGADFEKCINSWKFSDFIFSIHLAVERDGTKNVPVCNIYTHKLFLFARSGFFRDLFSVYRDLRKTNIIVRCFEERPAEDPLANSDRELEKSSEEKKNFIYVPSYFVFLVFLKWVYTDAIDLDLPESDHMAKLLDNPLLPKGVPEDEERTTDDLLSLARKFKAVGLIAILIQHKNLKEKKKREKQRAIDSAARKQKQKGKAESVDRSGRRDGDRRMIHRKGDLGSGSSKGKKGGSKTGSGSRTEKLKKFISSSPSTLSSGSVPTTYPYGEMSTSTSAQQTTPTVTYPYGEMSMSTSTAPSLSASLSPSHQPMRLAYDSDDDDSAIGLKKANASAVARKNGKEGRGGGRGGRSGNKERSGGARGTGGPTRGREEINSGEYRTGIMRLVASSNSPAPPSPPLHQQSPYTFANVGARSLLAPPPVTFRPPLPTAAPSSSSSSFVSSPSSSSSAAMPVFAIPSTSSSSSSSLLRPPPTSHATSPYASPHNSSSPSPSAMRSADSGQAPLFSLPAYTPAAFSIPATTIQQGSSYKANTSHPSSSTSSSSSLSPYSLSQTHFPPSGVYSATNQQPPSPYSPPVTTTSSSYSALAAPLPRSHRTSPPAVVRPRAFSIPTLVIEEASSSTASPSASSPSSTTTAASSSLLSSFPLPSSTYLSASPPRVVQSRPGVNEPNKSVVSGQSLRNVAQPSAAPPSSAGYSDLEAALPMHSPSSPFPPPAHRPHYQPSFTASVSAKRPPSPTSTSLLNSKITGSVQSANRPQPASPAHAHPAPRLPSPSSSSFSSSSSSSSPSSSPKSASPSAYAPSAQDGGLPSSATTAGLGSSKGILKAAHSRNQSEPDMSSVTGGPGGGVAPDDAQVSFLKNGRITMLTSLEKTKTKAKSKGKPKMEKSKQGGKQLVDRKGRTDVSSESSTGGGGGGKESSKATSKAEKNGKEKEVKHDNAHEPDDEEDEDEDEDTEDAEEEAEIEIEASDESDAEERTGDSSTAGKNNVHRRNASCIKDVGVAQQSSLKHNWRDSL